MGSMSAQCLPPLYALSLATQHSQPAWPPPVKMCPTSSKEMGRTPGSLPHPVLRSVSLSQENVSCPMEAPVSVEPVSHEGGTEAKTPQCQFLDVTRGRNPSQAYA